MDAHTNNTNINTNGDDVTERTNSVDPPTTTVGLTFTPQPHYQHSLRYITPEFGQHHQHHYHPYHPHYQPTPSRPTIQSPHQWLVLEDRKRGMLDLLSLPEEKQVDVTGVVVPAGTAIGYWKCFSTPWIFLYLPEYPIVKGIQGLWHVKQREGVGMEQPWRSESYLSP